MLHGGGLPRDRAEWLSRTAVVREAWLAAHGREFERGHDRVLLVPVDDPRVLRPRPPLQTPVLPKAARKRWQLAAALAAELTDESGPAVAGNDLVSAVSVSLPVAYLDSVPEALSDAPDLAVRLPHRVRVTAGAGGYVVLVQGEEYSVVFRFAPDWEPVLVLTDEMPGYAVRVDEDLSGEGSRMVAEAVLGVLEARDRAGAAERFVPGG